MPYSLYYDLWGFLYCCSDSGKVDLEEIQQFNVFCMLDDECLGDHPIHKGLDLCAMNVSE